MTIEIDKIYELIQTISELTCLDFCIIEHIGRNRSSLLKKIILDIKTPLSTTAWHIERLEKKKFLEKSDSFLKTKSLKLTVKGYQIFRIIQNDNEMLRFETYKLLKQAKFVPELTDRKHNIEWQKNLLNKYAWKELNRLTQDECVYVRRYAAKVFGASFNYLPDHMQAWEQLHKLSQDKDSNVRWSAAISIGAVFKDLPDRMQAWEQLHKLSQDNDDGVRWGAAISIGAVFKDLPDHMQAWEQLHKLSQDNNGNVRSSANYFLGRIYILNARETESEDNFKNELEKAIEFLKISSKDESYSRFFFSFYNLFYTVTFRKEYAEAEMQKSLSEIKNITKDSASNGKLLEAIKNLVNILKDIKNAEGMNFKDLNGNFKTYMQYCEEANYLMDTTEYHELADSLQIIDNKIKGVSEEIQDKTKILSSKKIKLTYHPEIAPEPTSDFIDREIERKTIFDSLNKVRLIIIQGMAGIGKTELAAKVRANLRDKYITYWKTIESEDNFDSIIHNLAGFFNENNNNILYQYLEQNGNDFRSIITHILTVLNANNYILFFDNYHNLNDEQSLEFFSILKEKLKNSTIILTTRVTPDFINPEDEIQNKILDAKLEGFDLKTTQEYFLIKGISLSQEQLKKINEIIGGHPLALLLFYSYINENKDININDSLEEIPKERIEKFLWKKVFPQLSLEEREILDFLSVFRKEIKSDTLSIIIKKDKVKENLLKLETKLLVKRKKNLYYLHDLLKEFCYDLIELPNRKKIHQNIADYYKLQEKTQENLVEASHHLISNYRIINEDIIDYFLSMPNDAYSFFIINEILKHNKIQTEKIFDLFEKFITSNDVQIITAFVLSYGYYFENIYAMDKKRSFEIYHKILQSYKDSGVLDAVSQSVKELAEIHPDESLNIWRKVIEINPQLADVVVIYLNDINLRNDKILNFLEDILSKTTNEFSKLRIIKMLDNCKKTAYKPIYLADHLNKMRNLSIIESTKYIEHNYKIMIPHFTTQVLSGFMKYDKPKTLELLKKVVEYHKESNNMMLFQVSEILCSSLDKKDLPLLNIFLNKENDNFSLIVGIRTLDLLSKKIEHDIILEYLNPFLNHENITIKKIAEITKKGINDKNYAYQRIRKDWHSFFRFLKICLNPQNIVSMLKTEFHPTPPFVISVCTWGTIKTIENYDTNEILDVGASVIESNNRVMLDASKWCMDKIQTDPKGFTDFIYKYGYKNKKISYKSVSIPWIILMGNLVPETVDVYLKEIMIDEADEAVISLIGNLRLYKNQDNINREEILKYLINHKNRDISGFADFLLNGLNKSY